MASKFINSKAIVGKHSFPDLFKKIISVLPKTQI